MPKHFIQEKRKTRPYVVGIRVLHPSKLWVVFLSHACIRETWPCRQFHSSGGKKSTTIFFYEDDTSEKSCQGGRLFGKRKQFYFYSGQRQRESIGWKVGQWHVHPQQQWQPFFCRKSRRPFEPLQLQDINQQMRLRRMVQSFFWWRLLKNNNTSTIK